MDINFFIQRLQTFFYIFVAFSTFFNILIQYWTFFTSMPEMTFSPSVLMFVLHIRSKVKVKEGI